MTAHLITFDLNKTGQNYEKIRAAIESYGLWAKIVTTTYIVISDKKCTEIRDHLKQYIDNNDELFIAKLTGEAAWIGLSTEVSEWLKQNL